MAKRVLIVDDSLLMRKMIADALTADGWTVAGEAASGQEAVAKYVELQPDVVTLDIVMPDTGGIYALQNILRFDPQAKIVVVSALNQTKLISEAIRKGALDFLVKPFLPEQLQAALGLYVAEPVAVG